MSSSASEPPQSPSPTSPPPDPSAPTTFAALGLCEELCDACASRGYTTPTPIQVAALPPALRGADLIGLAQTGSGKTAAFALPILQALLECEPAPKAAFAVVVAPTRELAFQIKEQFDAMGGEIGARSVTLTGGIDMMTQALVLAKKPHIVVATPGRLVDHLENTKGFNLRQVKYLVLDEADRLLNLDFEKEINTIISVLPRERITYLFSATMTSKVQKLQRASLKKPVRIEVSDKYTTVDTLRQNLLFVPAKYKDCYFAYLCNEFAGNAIMVFVDTQNAAMRLAEMLRALGFAAVCVHGGLSQPKRLGALNKFKARERNILIATDVASRGLDIPSVDLVINFDIPANGKDYIHRVGRTARAGRAGRAINLVSQYDVELYQKVEQLIGKKLEPYPCEERVVLLLLERVSEAQRIATLEIKEMAGKKNTKRKSFKGADDDGRDGGDAGMTGMGHGRGGSKGKKKKGKY